MPCVMLVASNGKSCSAWCATSSEAMWHGAHSQESGRNQNCLGSTIIESKISRSLCSVERPYDTSRHSCLRSLRLIEATNRRSGPRRRSRRPWVRQAMLFDSTRIGRPHEPCWMGRPGSWVRLKSRMRSLSIFCVPDRAGPVRPRQP
jgi:hypothetical protein